MFSKMNLQKRFIFITAIAVVLIALLGSGIMSPTVSAKSDEGKHKGEDRKTSESKQNQHMTGLYTLDNPKDLGNGIKEGGFSALTHLPGDPKNVFYTVSDRGPNGQVGKDELRTFPLEKFTPRMYKVSVSKGKITILKTIKLKLPNGKIDPITSTSYISGVSNIPGYDETPYNETGTKQLPYDPNGLDTEGISYNAADGTFWLCEEYSPSLIHVKADGTIISRYVPKGLKAKLSGSQVPVYENIPAVFTKRKQNKGFEGLDITPDGKYLFVAIQSPLVNPDMTTQKNSRNLRILKMDLKTKKVVGEYMYQAEESDKAKISDLAVINDHTLLVDERDKNTVGIYKADLSHATNLLGTDVSKNTFESLTTDQLKEQHINTAKKSLVLNVLASKYNIDKVEGVAIVKPHSLAIVDDNDFGVNYDSSGKMTLTDVPTQIGIFHVRDKLTK